MRHLSASIAITLAALAVALIAPVPADAKGAAHKSAKTETTKAPGGKFGGVVTGHPIAGHPAPAKS